MVVVDIPKIDENIAVELLVLQASVTVVVPTVITPKSFLSFDVIVRDDEVDKTTSNELSLLIISSISPVKDKLIPSTTTFVPLRDKAKETIGTIKIKAKIFFIK